MKSCEVVSHGLHESRTKDTKDTRDASDHSYLQQFYTDKKNSHLGRCLMGYECCID